MDTSVFLFSMLTFIQFLVAPLWLAFLFVSPSLPFLSFFFFWKSWALQIANETAIQTHTHTTNRLNGYKLPISNRSIRNRCTATIAIGDRSNETWRHKIDGWCMNSFNDTETMTHRRWHTHTHWHTHTLKRIRLHTGPVPSEYQAQLNHLGLTLVTRASAAAAAAAAALATPPPPPSSSTSASQPQAPLPQALHQPHQHHQLHHNHHHHQPYPQALPQALRLVHHQHRRSWSPAPSSFFCRFSCSVESETHPHPPHPSLTPGYCLRSIIGVGFCCFFSRHGSRNGRGFATSWSCHRHSLRFTSTDPLEALEPHSSLFQNLFLLFENFQTNPRRQEIGRGCFCRRQYGWCLRSSCLFFLSYLGIRRKSSRWCRQRWNNRWVSLSHAYGRAAGIALGPPRTAFRKPSFFY